MKAFLALITISTLAVVLGSPAAALNPSQDVSHYAHTAWTAEDGFSVGAIYSMAQTPDGYLWLGSEFGLFRFDGVRPFRWQPPSGPQLPSVPYTLLVTRDGTLWIGTFEGLASWDGRHLIEYPELNRLFVSSLLQDHEGTVWAGVVGELNGGRLCAIRGGRAECDTNRGGFGSFVWSLGEDNSGTLWAGAESGLWRWKPGPPKRYAIREGRRVGDMIVSGDGSLLLGISGAGIQQLVANKIAPYPIHGAIDRNALLPDRQVDSNKLLRDRDGGLWIGTHAQGLIHVHNGRTDVFTKSDGLSGDISCSLFEDREGNIWFASSRGLDRFRELPVNVISKKGGLSNDHTYSVLAARDGGVWISSKDGVTRWKDGHPEIFRKESGLSEVETQSLYEDHGGGIWVSTRKGIFYFNDGRFLRLNYINTKQVYSIAGDETGSVWLSSDQGLLHVSKGRLVEQFPWSALGRNQQAKVVIPENGGVWLAFWSRGGILYFKDGKVRTSFTAADGLGKGHVAGLRLDRDRALWAATEEGGLSRIKDGRIATLSIKNGLPCDAVHWSIEDDDRSVWLYTACGLLRIERAEMDAWVANREGKVRPTLFDTADGVTLVAVSPGTYGPPVTKAVDGKVWFLGEEGISVLDPHHLAINKLPPIVHVERVVADDTPYEVTNDLRLPSRIRDLEIGYTALSFAVPEKIHFKYKLEGQDRDWKEVVNRRRVQYTNLGPGSYRFRVIASNNSGIWNEQGDVLDFSIAPAYYETNWFRTFCAAVFLALLWAAYQFRVHQLHRQYELTVEARVAERTRIAREIHDTLLQSFHGLLLRFETASQLLTRQPLEAKEQLNSAIQQAADAITEGRDAVQGLRASEMDTTDLALAVSTLGKELANRCTDRRPEFHVAVEGTPRNLEPIARDEVYKIAAEALRNAFQHAEARRIEVEIRYDDQEFRLRNRDDGKGMDPAIVSAEGRERHYGLRGMRERAKLIASALTIWSEVNAGTEVELRVPASAAYATGKKQSWLSKRFVAKQ